MPDFKNPFRKLFRKSPRHSHDVLVSPSRSATPSTTRPNTPARENVAPRTSAPRAPFSESEPHSPSPPEPAPSLPSHSQPPIANDPSSSSSRMLQTVGKVALKGALALRDVLDGVPAMGILKSALGSLLEVIQTIQQKREADAAFKELDDMISELCSNALEPMKGKQEVEIPPEVNKVLIEFAEGIRKIIDEKELLRPASSLHAYLDAEESMLVIKKLKCQINLLFQQSIFKTQLTITLADYGERIKAHVRNLPATRIAYDSESSGSARSRHRTRSGNTAARILDVIDEWVDSDSDPNILIVHGLAGVGKSTIAQSVAESRVHSADGGRELGAVFFFTRDQVYDHKAFFPTIAYQLADFDPLYLPHLGSYIGSALRIEDIKLQEQVSKMIVEPLSRIRNAPASRALIIIDALDEFDQREASSILGQLLQSIPKTSLKVLITCRLEPHLKRALGIADDESPKSTRSFKSEDMMGLIDSEDISTFIHSELSVDAIKKEFPHAKWNASPADYDRLVRAAGSLFIVAATMVDFIKDQKHKNPERRRQLMLASIDKVDQSNEFPYATLDKVYITILRSSLPTPLGEDFMERYQNVVGTIVFLQQPLNTEALAAFIGLDSDQVNAAIHHLTSVIHEKNRCPQVYHASFANFLTDRKRCAKATEAGDPVFYIDANEHHARLAELCLDAMLATPTKRNILDLSDDNWFKNRKDQNVTEEQIGEFILPQLQYACRYWSSHFSPTSKRGGDVVKKLEGFAMECLLFWIEALSWMENLTDGLFALVESQEWVVPDQVRSIFYDGQRLLMMYHDILESAPLHLYSSVLPSIPSQTSLFQLYNENVKKGVEMLSGQPIWWDAPLAALHGHTNEVTSITFSPDGNRLASASDDNTVRLWDGVAGNEMVTLNGHTHWIFFVTFSPDGNRLASASDNTVRLWDSATGKEMASLNGHTDWVRFLAFSPDGNRLASASDDKTIRLWDTVTGNEIATLNHHMHWVTSVIFSPDGNRLASASLDCTVRLWDGVSGKNMATLNGHTHSVTFVTFSPDGYRLASASYDNTIRLWDRVTGNMIATLMGHKYSVRSVTFSPDGNRLASTSDDHTIRLWDVITRDCLSHWPVAQPPMKSFPPIFFSQTLFLPSTVDKGFRHVSLLSDGSSTLGPPLFWLPPWFKVHQWWILPTGGLFISNPEGKVLILAPVVNS